MARKGILEPRISALGGGDRKPNPAESRMMPRGAVGALQSSLSKLQENAVQEIDADLIDDAGFEDRLGLDPAAQAQLRDSLQIYGQQVPVLLRPHPAQNGRFEIVYGRRRLGALRELGMKVKAMVRQLDDHALVMAQGQENTSRQDLSFIEKASFAAQLQDSGYERQTIAAALSIDLPMVSRMLKVGTAFALPFLRRIGSAPGIGRDRWMALASALEAEAARTRAEAAMAEPAFETLESDARFEAVYAATQRKASAAKAPAPRPRTLRARDGAALAEIRGNSRGLTLTVPARTADGFDRWLDAQAEEIIKELHDRWQSTRSEG
ncbi:plasmid partitioning protein RepB [Salipiger mangrovisoli]|uniref:Plasmid partitioning protein RepB n=1 Tax=Salipiger mangrovisoli TaxID=2865933 RepID=A0ABR9X8T3_9RHOB|nr:plasmid partitioning protein RepB [Salipiger mangrovisoli]MBE9639999.1 plasmid partitioning protein RepB [Salipiger mangrovisoli]